MLNYLRKANTADLLTTIFGALSAAAEAIHEGPDILEEPWKVVSLISFAVVSYFANHTCEMFRDNKKC